MNSGEIMQGIGFGNQKYEMALLDPSSLPKEPKIPQLNFANEISIKQEDIKSMVVGAGNMGKGSDVSLSSSNEELVISASNKMDTFTMKLPIENGKDARSKYPLDYLEDIAKSTSRAKDMKLSFRNEYPMRIQYKIGDSIDVEYILAPRIDQEE